MRISSYERLRSAVLIQVKKARGGKPLRLTAKDLAYVEVERWLGLFHEVAPKAQALKCDDSHGANASRLDWKALRYRGDPQKSGGRKLR
jgi:hypothetical protein